MRDPDERRVFSLLEVATSIQKTLHTRYQSSFWVKAEMNKLNFYPHSGHCYPELLEKKNGRVIAQLKANLWRDDYLRINERFLAVLGEPLKDGITILFNARITFDAMHGLSLRIQDIDPVFSLGELEREKQETLARLREEGIFMSNKSKFFPLLPKRIAVISVQTSKGYADFQKVLDGNPWGYRIFHVLFPSLLQGERAIESICNQLKRIRMVVRHFDAVAIVRGGGGDVGLSFLNHYRLAREIALFPIPVITGIGHATNETVTEMVAFKNAITPTELADFLLQRFHDFALPLSQAAKRVKQNAVRILNEEHKHFGHTIRYFNAATASGLRRFETQLRNCARSLGQETFFVLKRQREICDLSVGKIRLASHSNVRISFADVGSCKASIEKSVRHYFRYRVNTLLTIDRAVGHLDPLNILKRGYSITAVNGKIVKSIDGVALKDVMTTHLVDGVIESQVNNIRKSGPDE